MPSAQHKVDLLARFLSWLAQDGPAPQVSGTGQESEEYEFEDAPGEAKDAAPKNGYAASIAFVAPSGKVLFVRRSPTEANWPDTWSWPGGRTEKGEDAAACAQREAREEIGDCSFDGIAHLETKRTAHDCEHTSFLVPAKDEFEPTLNDEHSAYTWAAPDRPPEPIHPGVKATLDGALARYAQDIEFQKGPGKVFQPVANLNRPLLVQEPKAMRVTSGQLREERKQSVANVAGGSTSRYPRGIAGDAENPPDAATVDVPLLIRLMEYAREDAPDDEALHRVIERVVAASGKGRTLGMADYDKLTGQKTSAEDVDDPTGKLSKATREDVDSTKHREDMPESAFLIPSQRKYPVKEKRDGQWKYARNLLLAAARRARMQGRGDLAKRADAIRKREFEWAQDVKFLAQDKKLFDADGRLHAEDVPLTKANVCEYLGREIPDYQKHGLDPDKRYKLYRHPEELKKAVQTFNRLPVLSKHVPVSADSHLSDLVVGATGSDARWDPPYLRNSVAIWPRSAIDKVENGRARELSSAYQYEFDPTPGKTPDGESYDGVMRNIVGNHVAQVEEGRAGHDVAIDDLAALQWAKLEGALRAIGVRR